MEIREHAVACLSRVLLTGTPAPAPTTHTSAALCLHATTPPLPSVPHDTLAVRKRVASLIFAFIFFSASARTVSSRSDAVTEDAPMTDAVMDPSAVPHPSSSTREPCQYSLPRLCAPRPKRTRNQARHRAATAEHHRRRDELDGKSLVPHLQRQRKRGHTRAKHPRANLGLAPRAIDVMCEAAARSPRGSNAGYGVERPRSSPGRCFAPSNLKR